MSNAGLTYLGLLADLHLLIASGQGDGPDADRIRDRMDRPWKQLSDREAELAQQLSIDLYATLGEDLAGNDSLAATDSGRTATGKDHLTSLIRAVELSDWETVGAELAAAEGAISREFAAHLRGRIWSARGCHYVSSVFLDLASRFAPANANYAYLALDALSRSERLDAAIARAGEILANPDGFDPYVVTKAVDVRLADLHRSNGGASVAEFARLGAISGDLLRRLPGDASASVRAQALVLDGLCQVRMGNREEALRRFDAALAADPDNAGALAARGTTLYGLDSGSVQNLRKAAFMGAPLVWPCFLLAHNALSRGLHEECEFYCQMGLQHDASPSIRARLLMWLAISLHEQGEDSETVRGLFNEAATLAPDDRDIVENQTLFETSSSDSGGASRCDYVREPESSIRDLAVRQFELPSAA